MTMKKVEDLFRVNASNPLDLAMLHSGRVGFVIPEYQRQYDWSEQNITRLYCDSLNGLRRLADNTGASSFTFLGTLILVEEETQESDFSASGVSVAIVDGQQRLTTLALFACALCEALHRERSRADFSLLEKRTRDWLTTELKNRLFALYECAVGSLRISPTKNVPFPKIIRAGDTRAASPSRSEYVSPIGKFLVGFANYFLEYEDEDGFEYMPPDLGKGASAEKLARNFQLIRNLVSHLNDENWYEDTECELFHIRYVERGQYRTLFEHLGDYFQQDSDRNRVISQLPQAAALHSFIRTLVYSAYFCRCIVLTRVTTEDESAAFDIFDALNTTGEPLTALETLKPLVIRFENNLRRPYRGSESEIAFSSILSYLDEKFLDTYKKQSETKDSIVTFALYIKGEKLSKQLAEQRRFLRSNYGRAMANGAKSARAFVQALDRIVQFRRYYWERSGIEELGIFHGNATCETVQLLATFLSDMKTSLALPILARYWTPYLRNDGDDEFLSAFRAVISFLVLRRAATGGTAAIDSDFRAIMAPKKGRGSSRKFSLCAGVDNSAEPLSVEDLKNALRVLLKHRLKRVNKDAWVNMVVANPLYEQSKGIVRFMLLAAAHQARPSQSGHGLWERGGVKPSPDENNFLNYRTWMQPHYLTVEHIAPNTEPSHGWPRTLYRNNVLRHTLGNLLLLPSKENAAIGGDSWEKKKRFYLALTETTEEGQAMRIAEAKAAGIGFSKATEQLLKSGGRLPLLDALRQVERWDENIVQKRSENIAQLSWDILWPWLN